MLRSAVMGTAAGGIVGGLQLLHRAGNVITTDTRINSLLYAIPLLSALWLWKAGDPIHQVPLFVFGAAVIVAINVAIGANRSRVSPAVA